MNYTEFKKRFPSGSTVATPEGTYAGQCVSYVRQYMRLVHGFRSGPLGHAAHFATNPLFLKHYQKVSSRKVGDIMVWGNDVGNWTNEYGHIAIYDGNGYMMNQNFGGSLEVSRNRIFTDGLIGYYRFKEDELYKGKSAKYWYEQYRRYYSFTRKWRLRYQSMYKKIKDSLGKYLGK